MNKTQILSLLGALLYMGVEWYLPRTKSIRARSFLELVGNLLAGVPLVKKLATPETEE